MNPGPKNTETSDSESLQSPNSHDLSHVTSQHTIPRFPYGCPTPTSQTAATRRGVKGWNKKRPKERSPWLKKYKQTCALLKNTSKPAHVIFSLKQKIILNKSHILLGAGLGSIRPAREKNSATSQFHRTPWGNLGWWIFGIFNSWPLLPVLAKSPGHGISAPMTVQPDPET